MLKDILRGLGHLIAPRVCRICGCSLTADEEYLCLGCRLSLPRTDQHRLAFNIIHQRLGHHCVVDRAAGWFFYRRRSPYAQLLIDAKYRGLWALAQALGRMCAEELSQEGFFSGLDVIVPMPMHWTKRWMRGYNQAHEICKGVSEVTGIPVAQALKAVRPHGVQARNSRDARYQSIKDTIALPEVSAIAGKNVLFVDDIITTGASASEAVKTLLAGSPMSVSVLSLGLTAEGTQ